MNGTEVEKAVALDQQTYSPFEMDDKVELPGDLTDTLFNIFDGIFDIADEDEAIFEPLALAEAEAERKMLEVHEEQKTSDGKENSSTEEDEAIRAEQSNSEATAADDVVATADQIGSNSTVDNENDEAERNVTDADDDETQNGDTRERVSQTASETRQLSEDEREDLKWRREQYREIDASRNASIDKYRRVEVYLKEQRIAADKHDAEQAKKPSYDTDFSTNVDSNGKKRCVYVKTFPPTYLQNQLAHPTTDTLIWLNCPFASHHLFCQQSDPSEIECLVRNCLQY